ncbi:restriction endonuclease subunit S [Methanosalsum natronophilum]|uniref:restriction endonuclease subunit S n=1 Tax=Methanosalsum natronophilum TaxID=768733 RepID=UPI0021676CB7|nr:restriction endonuclease subunit S [Methanosalsum natronophilum]MCS3924441.1 type I restriction enzyme S subunit [Methanosalsum natronophilum]
MSSSQVKYMDSSGMKPYPEYKDSNAYIKQLKYIPKHWSLVRNIGLFEERNVKNYPHLPLLSVSQAYGVILQKENKKLTERKDISSDNKANYKLVKSDDLVYNKMRMWQGAVGQSKWNGIVSPAYVILKPIIQTDARYFYYLYKTPQYISEFGRFSYGICDDMNSLRYDDFKNIFSLYPPLEEQHTIASFLDRETSRIDALVEKKQQFIELLEERRSALISHAVTKGLNPDVPMKDSGIEWIGEIPEHWDTIRIKHATYVKGRIGWHGLRSDEFIDEGAFLVTGTDFVNGRINWDSCYHISKNRYDQDPYIQLKENDLLITKDGTIGKVALVKGLKSEATLNSGIFVTRPLSNNYITDFMYWILNSEVFTAFFEYMSNGTTIQHLYQNVFNEFAFPIPPLKEQQAIADYLDNETSQIDNLIEKTEQSIEYLKEYRTALISSAVTGKIDVRGTVSD